MSKRKRSEEVRVVIGSGYIAGDLDARDAGPIPESAGVKVVAKKRASRPAAPGSKRGGPGLSDTIRIARSHRPWEPGHGARLVQTLNYYDRPLSGIIEQDGARFLFDCVAGHIEDWHLWCYRRLTGAELDSIDSVEPGEPCRQLMRELLAEGPFAVAVADDEGGIVGAQEVDTLEPEALRTAIELIWDAFRDDTARRSALASEVTEQLLGQASHA